MNSESMQEDQLIGSKNADRASFRMESVGKGFNKARIKKFFKTNALVVAIVTAAVLGTIIGVAINQSIQKLEQPDRYTAIIVLGFPGEILLRCLKMLILPLITFSLIVGLSSLNNTASGKIGARAVTYYLTTTVLAAVLGLILVSAIQPGNSMVKATHTKEKKNEPVRPLDSFMDIVRNMFPPNIVKACVQQDKTKIVVKYAISYENRTFDFSKMSKNESEGIKAAYNITKVNNTSTNTTSEALHYATIEKKRKYKIGKGLRHTDKANFLGLIVFALAVGKIAGSMGDRAKPFVDFITVFNEITTKLVIYVMWFSPVGIMSLIIAQFAEMENISGTFSSLALFMLTVVLGIFIHGFIVLPAIFFGLTRQNPYKYMKGLTEALFTAFGTDSSAATLPITFRCLEENLRLDKRITRFILPVGATINMDGTALYEAVSAIFISQASGVSLSFGDYIGISFTSILASVGAAAIPHAGLVTMLIVLDTVGLPTDLVAIIFTVDWLLDRFRTMLNVFGDAIGTGIVQHLSRAELKAQDQENSNHVTTSIAVKSDTFEGNTSVL